MCTITNLTIDQTMDKFLVYDMCCNVSISRCFRSFKTSNFFGLVNYTYFSSIPTRSNQVVLDLVISRATPPLVFYLSTDSEKLQTSTNRGRFV